MPNENGNIWIEGDKETMPKDEYSSEKLYFEEKYLFENILCRLIDSILIYAE